MDILTAKSEQNNMINQMAYKHFSQFYTFLQLFALKRQAFV